MDIRKWLEQFPSSEELAHLYQDWRSKYPLLKQFSIPKQLTEYLHDRIPEKFKSQDAILYSLVSECKSKESSPVMVMYLFILLNPFLEIVFYYWKKIMSSCGVTDEEIWNELWIAYREILNGYDRKQKDRIGLYFQGKARNILEKRFRKIVRQRKYETIFNDELEQSEQDSGSANAGEDISEMEKILEQLVRDNVIDSIDKYLIKETRLRKKQLQKVASKVSLKYFAAAKKRSRAEIRIIEVLQKNIY